MGLDWLSGESHQIQDGLTLVQILSEPIKPDSNLIRLVLVLNLTLGKPTPALIGARAYDSEGKALL